MMSEQRTPSLGAAMAGELSDDLAVILASDRRQYLLMTLSERRAPRELGDIAARVASEESAGRTDERGAVDEAEVAFSLHYQHLPALDECSIVAYDSDRRRAGLTTVGAGWATVLSQRRERLRDAKRSR